MRQAELGQAMTTYGNLLSLMRSLTACVSPEVVAVFSTSENVTSGALSDSDRPLRTVNP